MMVLFAEVFPCNPSEEEQHDPHHLSCACAASPCSPVGPSPIILSSSILLSSGLAAKMTRLFFCGESVARNLFQAGVRCAAQSPRCSPTLFFLTFFGHCCKSTRIFFFTSKMVHETGLREVAGRSDRHTRSGSDCLRGNLRLLRTHFCDGRNCHRSFPTGRACRLSKTGTWTREGHAPWADLVWVSSSRTGKIMMGRTCTSCSQTETTTHHAKAFLCLRRNMKDIPLSVFFLSSLHKANFYCCGDHSFGLDHCSMRRGESVHVSVLSFNS